MFTPTTKLIELYIAPDAVPELVEVARYDDPRGFCLWCTRDGRVCKKFGRCKGKLSGKYAVLTSRLNNGYYYTCILIKGSSSKIYINRAVCSAWHGPCPHTGWQADHINGQRLDNRARNLQWLSPQENRKKRKKNTFYSYEIYIHRIGCATPLFCTPRVTDTIDIVGRSLYTHIKSSPAGWGYWRGREYEVRFKKSPAKRYTHYSTPQYDQSKLI